MPTDHDSIVVALRGAASLADGVAAHIDDLGGSGGDTVRTISDGIYAAIPAVESLVAENVRLTLAVTNAKLDFDAIWRAVQVGSGHDDADAANEAGRVSENASRMMARALKGDD